MRGRIEGAGKKLVRECLARMGYTINRIDPRNEAYEPAKLVADTVGDVLERTSARLIRVVDTLGVFRFRRQTASDRAPYAG